MTTSDKPEPTAGEPEEPARPPLPSLDELRERGFVVLPPSGKGFIIPVGKIPPQKPEP